MTSPVFPLFVFCEKPSMSLILLKLMNSDFTPTPNERIFDYWTELNMFNAKENHNHQTTNPIVD